MLPFVAAVLILIPSIGLQAAATPVQMPANEVLATELDQLGQVSPGDQVVLMNDDGTTDAYIVAWSRLYPTKSLPPEVLDGPASGGQVVTLITDEQSDNGYATQRVVRAVSLP